MQQGLLFAPVADGVNRITTFVSVRMHGGKLAHTAPIYADAAGAVAQLRVSGEVHVNADGAVTSA